MTNPGMCTTLHTILVISTKNSNIQFSKNPKKVQFSNAVLWLIYFFREINFTKIFRENDFTEKCIN